MLLFGSNFFFYISLLENGVGVMFFERDCVFMPVSFPAENSSVLTLLFFSFLILCLKNCIDMVVLNPG